MHKHFIKSVSLVVCILFSVSSCAANNIKESTDESVTAKTITRVAIAKECPVTKAKPQSFASAASLALFPPLVEAGLKGIGGAIKKAGEAKTFTTSATSYTDFYSYDYDMNHIIANPSAVCIVAFRAKIGGVERSANFAESKVFNSGDANGSSTLFKNYGISNVPAFYYEATIVPSHDRTAFRLSPKLIYYGDKIGPNKKDKQLVVNLSFGKPSAELEDQAFAIHAFTMSRNGGQQVVSDSHFLDIYESKYLPLPSLSSSASESVKLFSEQNKQRKELKKELDEINKVKEPRLIRYAQDISDLQEILNDEIGEKRAAVELARKNCNLPQCDVRTNIEIANLEQDLKDAQKAVSLRRQIKDLEKSKANLEAQIAVTDKRSNLIEAISALDKQIEASSDILDQSTPVNISLSLTETTSANKFLVALGDAIAGSAETAKTKLTEKLTPEDPEAELAVEVSDLKEINQLRTSAIQSVGAWDVESSKYTAASDVEKKTLLPALRVAYFKAKLDCDIVERYGLVEPTCLGLVPPPSQ